jgi:hypothetical protein
MCAAIPLRSVIGLDLNIASKMLRNAAFCNPYHRAVKCPINLMCKWNFKRQKEKYLVRCSTKELYFSVYAQTSKFLVYRHT